MVILTGSFLTITVSECLSICSRIGDPTLLEVGRHSAADFYLGESETAGVNIGLLFALTTPGIYHVVARRIVRRLEVLGEKADRFSTIYVCSRGQEELSNTFTFHRRYHKRG